MRKVALGYAIFVALMTLGLALMNSQDQARKEEGMSWVELSPVTVNAKPDGMWTWGYDWIEGPALIKVEATGTWHYSPGAKECTADGDLNCLVASGNCLMPDAPVGALILKIGGGTAGAKDGKQYLAGHKAIVEVDKGVKGPLLLTINDEPTGMSDNSGSIEVKLSVKKLPAAIQPPGNPAPQPQPPAAPNPAPAPAGGPAGAPVHVPIPKSGGN